MVAFDLTSTQEFANVTTWISEIKSLTGENNKSNKNSNSNNSNNNNRTTPSLPPLPAIAPAILLVGTKRDKKGRREVRQSLHVANLLSSSTEGMMNYFETSSKLDLDVNEAFITLAETIYRKK